MARKSNSTILQEELYPPGVDRPRADFLKHELDDARLVDLDVDQESPFLRGQKRVSARRNSLPKKTAHGLLWAAVAATFLCVGAFAAAGLYHYGEHSWRFRVASSDDIEISGMDNVSRTQIMDVMGADIGRNIFFVPLAQQKIQLEQIPWVESASVMRFVPNRLKVEIQERTPIAFARVGQRISLIDAGGTLMEFPRNHKYSFPVILGMNPGEPLSSRAPRMRAYNDLVRTLDSGGAHYSQDLSEVDLSDLEDLKVRVNDPAGDVVVELGSTDYLKRYKTYVSHVQEWRQQFQKLESVSLRYDNQVIVNPEIEGRTHQAALSLASGKASASVRSAALLTRVTPSDKSVPKPAFELSQGTVSAKPAAVKKPRAKAKAKSAKHAVASASGRRSHGRPAHASRRGEGSAKAAAKADAKKPDASKPQIPVLAAPTSTARRPQFRNQVQSSPGSREHQIHEIHEIQHAGFINKKWGINREIT
jgi:cell division protein FtsQ